MSLEVQENVCNALQVLLTRVTTMVVEHTSLSPAAIIHAAVDDTTDLLPNTVEGWNALNPILEQIIKDAEEMTG